MNSILTGYILIFFIVIVSLIPIIIMSLFGYLTYQNISQTKFLSEQQADRQLIKMTFSQIIFALICSSALDILQTYNTITSGFIKD